MLSMQWSFAGLRNHGIQHEGLLVISAGKFSQQNILLCREPQLALKDSCWMSSVSECLLLCLADQLRSQSQISVLSVCLYSLYCAVQMYSW